MRKVNRSERIDIRLLELETEFYDYVDLHQHKPRALIRHFIKNGLKGEGGLTIEQHQELKDEIILLRKSMSRIGGNLNQIAQYFNTHNHLIESDLHRQLKDSKEVFKETTDTLKEVMNVI